MGIFSRLVQWWRTRQTANSPNPLENVDYVLGEYFPDGEGNTSVSTVRVLTGPYTGVEFCYFNVRVAEHIGSAQLSFKYSFVDTATFTRDSLKNDARFVQFAGDVLRALLSREGGMNDTVGTNDSQESNL